MRYFLDTEFNEFGGQLMSLAMIAENGRDLYLVFPMGEPLGPWVAENVEPVLFSIPPGVVCHTVTPREGAFLIQSFLGGDPHPIIVSDWPDDIRYFCEEIITGPGEMVGITQPLGFLMQRVDAYPTTLPGAVQHNAWWDAMALRHLLMATTPDAPAVSGDGDPS